MMLIMMSCLITRHHCLCQYFSSRWNISFQAIYRELIDSLFNSLFQLLNNIVKLWKQYLNINWILGAVFYWRCKIYLYTYIGAVVVFSFSLLVGCGYLCKNDIQQKKKKKKKKIKKVKGEGRKKRKEKKK
eukprot:TRINITY_DN32750_c1_g1_i3.p4 TRINITY_DN32750_c1_g1~~TRINITY_DN32750_c1_g1_i3.p4  ORF type:complete len:130 (+),score=5.67 TRINITY_DN32750_c1_g1_i3:454-843(+)